MKNILPLRFDLKLFLWLYIAFIVFTVIGTLSHELGHYFVAKQKGHQAKIHHMAMSSWGGKHYDSLGILYQQYEKEIKTKADFPNKDRFIQMHAETREDRFWIILGGPLQTMLTGILGLLGLIFFRNRVIKDEEINMAGWFLVMLSLFWLRQAANFAIRIVRYFITQKPSYLGDEHRLALYLGINTWTIQAISGFFAFLVLIWIIFFVIPKQNRLTFLIAGLFGGISGYYLWIIRFGKYLLP